MAFDHDSTSRAAFPPIVADGAGLAILRLFLPGATAPADLLAGLDLTRFSAYHPDVRGHGPLTGLAGAKINASEAFFGEALAAIRAHAVVIPDPFGAGTIATTDVFVSPGTPWDTVPIYVCRFAGVETFYFLKRGLSWCTDLGLFFPRRQLLVSFQRDDLRLTQDCDDLRGAFRFLAEHRHAPGLLRDAGTPAGPPCVVLTSGHFAHHLWNELSVVEGIVADGLQDDVRLIVNQQPLGDIATLFPEIPRAHIVSIDGASRAALLHAMTSGHLVVPAGRRFIPHTLVERVLGGAAATHPADARQAAEFRAAHELVLWVTVRVDARTAVNLVPALARALGAVLSSQPGSVGVVFDGYTLSALESRNDWNTRLIAHEREAVAAIVDQVPMPFDHVVLAGRPTMAAFLWTQAADYYVTPYGTAQHKVAWLHVLPGLVHAGENKRAVAWQDPGVYARQSGPPPRFVFGQVARHDVIDGDARQDLFSYELDVEALAEAVREDVARLLATRRA